MNKRVLHLLSFLFLLSTTAFSQAVTMATATGGLSGAAQISGTNNIAILGVQLTKAGGGGNTVTTITVAMTPTPVGKFTNARLFESADATFSGVGTETQIAAGTISATDISFTGAPLSNFDGATATADDEYFFIVVDVDPAASGSTTPSLASAGVIVSTGTTAGTTITGSTYTLTPPQTTIANLSTGLASSPLQAGANAQGVFGFSLTSNGTQTLSTLNIQTGNTSVGKWSSFSLITSTDNSFATTGDNSAPIGGLTFNATATEIQITGLSQSITTSGTNFFLVADVNAAVNGSTTAVTPSLGSSNATATTGTFTGTATGTAYSFAPLLTIANLTTGLASSPLTAGATNQGVFGFSLTSSGSQTVTVLNVQLSSTPASKWSNYRLITSTDANYATTGDNSAPIGGLTFTPSASQVAITGLSQVITSGTNYFLVVDIDPAVTGGTGAVQPSLGPSNVTITTGAGVATGTATGTNYNFGLATATFTEITAGTAPVISTNVLSAGSTLQVLTGFSVTSNGTQTITSIGFNYSGLGSQFTDEYLYRSTVAGSVGTQVASDNSPDGNFGSLTETINGTTVYFYLVVDVANSVNSGTASVTTAPTQANITVAAGNKNALSISRTFTFATSQNSNIILNSGTTDNIDYITKRTGTPLTSGNSVSLATFRIQDGGGSSDLDNSSTTLTTLQIQLTNFGMVRRIALFDGASIIAGTQQDVSSATITFSGLTLSASDNNNKDFTVRATFQNTVTDNAIVDVTIQSATASSSGSGFAAGNAGGASSTSEPSADANKIEVAASALAFTGNPANTAINTPFGLVIQAKDAQNNIDLDYNSQVALTATGGAGTLTVDAVPPPPAESLTPALSGGVYTWTTLQLNQSGTYTLTASDDAFDDNFTDPTATVTITSSASNITGGGTGLPLCYGTAFTPLNSILITETDAGGISGTNGTYTFSIALPAGFVFDASVNSGASASGGSDISGVTGYTYLSSNTVVQFGFTLNGTANVNTITIAGLKVGHPHPGNNMPGNVRPPAITGAAITRSGGSANIAGVIPGTSLCTIDISQPPIIAAFTVDELPGDVTVDPATTNFNVNANSVKLVASITTPPGTNLFSGSGVTFNNPDYRFNPTSLSPGAYDIRYTNSDGSGCQREFIKTFTVYTSGINGLALTYCNNDLPSTALTVSGTFMDQRLGVPADPVNHPWQVDYFVYYDPNVFDFVPIASPSNDIFDPSLATYQSIIQYFGGQIPIGFAACDNNTVPCGSNQNYGVFSTYQWVTVNTAPTPTFTLPKTVFCVDEPAVILTGTPPNSDNTTTDKFVATDIAPPFNPSPNGTITQSVPPTGKVWSFNPSALGVGTANITYTYENPSTGCSGTSAPTMVTVYGRPNSVLPAAITSPGGIAPETCQGAPIGTFTATPLAAPSRYTWYSDIALTNIVGTGNSFAPPNPPVDPNTPTTVGNPPKFYVTQTINGCESNKQPVSPTLALELSVTVKPAPAAPTPNFPDPQDREFCVGANISSSTLVVPGTGVKWYMPGSSTSFFSGTSPDTTALSIPNPTTMPATYDFEVTQTVSLCESPRTPVRVRIKGLPILSVSSGASDPLKICTEGGHDGGSPTLITFSGSDENGPVSTGSWTVQSGTLTPGALIPGGGTALLNTPTLIPGNYILRFSHTNSALCANFIDIDLTVLPKITPSLDPLDSCFENFVRLNNDSEIQTSSAPGVPVTPADVISTSWNFNDGNTLAAGSGPIVGVVNNGRTKGTYLSPEHNFAILGSKSVAYTMTTQYCAFSGTEQLTINPKPKIDFSWRNPCFDSATMQSATRFVATETTTPAPIAISQYIWNFNTESNLTHSGSPAGATPTVNYTNIGSDSVELIVITASQCRDTIQKIVHILPTYKAITDSTGYDQSFNAGSNFWITGGLRSSWALGNTTAGTEPSNGNAWATSLLGTNNNNEQSWVMSGCFNFSRAVKPVASLDVWSDTPFGVDGAVLQYNENGRIEEAASWNVLGDVGTGINWYDGSGISNSPGDQSSNDFGWTGTYPGWKKAIYKLDDVKPATPTSPDSLIVFRVAFGGGNRQQSGFAFDNVFIGERSRVVLLENFTNTSPEANGTNATTLQNIKYADNSGDVLLGEIVKIQYHTPFPGTDLLNAANPQMNNSRAAFYGITEAPAARVDGGFQSGNLTAWFDDYNDDRVLTPSFIKIKATTQKVGSDVKINVTLTNTTGQSLPLDGTNVFVVVVQKQLLKTGNEDLFGSTGNTEFVYVARQMLPSAAGIPLKGSLAAASDYTTIPEITWSSPDGGDALVIFVQKIDGDLKTVYQAHFVGNPAQPDAITGTEDPEYVKNIQVYPNPANQLVNIELPAAAAKPTPVVLIDAFGKTVYQSEFRMGEKTKAVSTEAMADGVYMLQLTTPGGSKAVRKVMVKH